MPQLAILTSNSASNLEENPYLFVFLEIFEGEGGIQSYVQDIFRSYLALSSQPNSDVFLLRDGGDRPNPFDSDSLKFHYFKTQPPALGRIKLGTALLNYLLRRRPQQVFCGHANLAPLIQMLCQPLGIPYTVLTYGKEIWLPLSNRARNALSQATQVWTISRYSRDCACAANGLDPQKFQLLPCAVDGDRFTPGPKSALLVERYNLGGSRVLMTVARLWSGDIYKGVDVTLRALPVIVQRFPNVRYLVIGRGDDQPRLVRLTQELGVADRVVFAGFVSTENLVEHYRLADAYIMPSQEGFGIVYLEAMACGIPVLAGNADGSADPLQDGQLGWRVPHRDPEAVAKGCIEILESLDADQDALLEPRCNGKWLRQQTIALFGKAALIQHLERLLVSLYLDKR